MKGWGKLGHRLPKVLGITLAPDSWMEAACCSLPLFSELTQFQFVGGDL